ncbi:acyl-CoA carboxylase epsilon subunit [Agromyces binzhouensis]|uniref:acyl-CoA carboxylase epsilon subunit n=1 Tax=Agromyces binzhouensis TaxID=1817495 RepID=UPI003630A337
MTSAPQEGDAQALDLRFLSRDVTADEAAAVTAVLVATVREAQGEHEVTPRNDWSHPRNALRPRVEVGPGRWTASAR